MKKENYAQKLTFFTIKTSGILLLLLLMALSSFSQEKSVVNLYVDYFSLPRESLFLHTNKTTYIIGESEEIWFTAYAYDRKSHLSSKATTNIHLGLYDASGELLEKKLFLAEEGIAAGNMVLDSTLTTGDYYLKIHTQWMKNFKEDDSFVKKIHIINPKKNQISDTKKIQSKEYDIQFLPEGGHLLSGIKNNVGIKALDDYGKGTKLSGVILDSKDQEVTKIKTNFLGLGKFSFTPSQGESYKAKITLDNSKELILELPKTEEKGITLLLNNLRKDQVLIDLATNEASFSSLKGKEFKLLIHQNGTTKIIPVTLNNPIERISIDKQLLFKGVNTVTLFDKNTPILERMFFNEAPIVNRTIQIDSWEAEGDSLRYNLSSTLKDSIILSASISILPSGTKSYNPRHSIISAFYLQPYLKGVIENPKYYFQNMNRQKKYALDLLLLTQGWSRYDWEDIFKNPPGMIYDFENGITINGSLNNTFDQASSLLLFPTKHNSSRFIKYDEKGRFQIKNYFPLSNEKLRFTFSNKRGKTKLPKMAVNSVMRLEKDRIDTRPFEEFTSYYSNINSIPENFLNKNEVLDTVVLSTRLNGVFNKRGPKFKGSIIKITDSVAKQYVTIDRILNTEKFNIYYDGPDMRIVAQEKINRGAPRPVVFFIDGAPIMNMHNFLTTNTTNFEDVYIDYSYNNVNTVQNGEIVYLTRAIIVNLFSRITLFDDPDLNRNTFNNFISLKHGFEPHKTFYTPRYIDYNIQAFKEYGVIHWESNTSFVENNSTKLTTINTGLKNVNFYIEGIGSDGSVFSQVIKLNNSNNE